MKNISRVLFATIIAFLLTQFAQAEEYVGLKNVKQQKQIKDIAAGCSPSSGFKFMDINNVRARINTGGDMWWDLPGGIGAQYFIPKSGTATSLFSGSLWIGGLDINNQLKLAAVRYRQVGNDYWSGPLTVDGTAAVDEETCSRWDRLYPMNRTEVDLFVSWYNSDNQAGEFPGYSIPQSILEWPAHGDVEKGQSYYLAPFYDNDGDGTYDPYQGDYPYYDLDNSLCPINYQGDPNYIPAQTLEEEYTEYGVPLIGSILVDQVIKGDATLWWIFNDKGNVHTETGGAPIGMEIQGQAFAFATNDVINNMTFYSYQIINRSTFELTQTYFSPWVDTDLGYAWDDYVGCDVLRGLGYCYNGPSVDGSGEPESYGAQPPAVGVDFFQGPYIDPDGFDNLDWGGDCNVIGQGPNPTVDQMSINGINFSNGIVDDERYGMRRFVYHNNGGAFYMSDPTSAPEYYNFLRGIWKDNTVMYYGGNAHYSSGAVGPECTFMFPGDSDPCDWGTNFQPPNGGYNQNEKYWTEQEAGNTAFDRRFMQSAGPFTLKSGAVNYITVGIPWARASAGGPWASVDLLRVVDDKCQKLFDNCFKVIDGPDAPTMALTELDGEIIFYISNSKTSNNYNEEYAEYDPNIIQPNPADPNMRSDSLYRFEGYQVYQLKDANVTLGSAKDDYGNFDPNVVRLVYQCDVQNGVGTLVNNYLDKSIGYNIPIVEVEGADEGIKHSFQLFEDAFATGDKRLVNYKQYYYAVIAYAYNSYLPFDPEDIVLKEGQKTPYLPGRKNIKTYTAIPHPPTGGTIMHSDYGEGPAMSRSEGRGNDGLILEITDDAKEVLMSKLPVGTVIGNDTVQWGHPDYPIVLELGYQANFGPLNIQVIDPLNVASGSYLFRVDSLWLLQNQNVTGQQALEAGGDTASYITGTWFLENEATGKIFEADATIDKGNEQIFLDLGISIKTKSIYFPGPYQIGKREGDDGPQIYEIMANNNGLLESRLTYADSSMQWLSGVPDNDVPTSPSNWIRSGTYNVGDAGDPIYNDYNVPLNPYDPNQVYEKLIGGTWAPYVMCAAKEQNPAGTGPALSVVSKSPSRAEVYSPYYATYLREIASVDIVFTANKDYWTRCPVIEMCPDPKLSENGQTQFKFRAAPSVDKNGNPADITTDTVGSDNPNDAHYISPTGMGWFPGYAVNLETGERLNMMFAEDSWLAADNGRDMLYNPTSSFYDFVSGQPRFGGKHYVYVMHHAVRIVKDSVYNFPAYDAGSYLRHIYDHYQLPPTFVERGLYSSTMYVGMPLAIDGEEWLSNDATVSIRIAKPYERYFSVPLDSAQTVNAPNKQYPMFKYNLDDLAVELDNETQAESDLENISVVPNPYYAYAGGAGYERNALDTRVKIINLPQEATITIYNVQGTLVRQYQKNDPLTYLDWDLKNFANVPIAGGVYIIHVKTNAGEKVVKWFGGIRQPDLNVF